VIQRAHLRGLEKSSQLRHYKSHPNSKVLLHKLEIHGKFQRICFCRWRLLPACCNYQVGIWKRAHIVKPVYPEPTHDNGWQCVDGMIEPKWVSGDFIPRQLADVLVEENIAGLTESDESDDEFDNVLYSLIDGEEED